MSILIYNCTAVLMDAAGTILRNAFVTVEGPKILSVGTQRPAGPFGEEIDAGWECSHARPRQCPHPRTHDAAARLWGRPRSSGLAEQLHLP